MYGGGLLLMTAAQGRAGTLGVPRRVASIDYGGHTPHGWSLPMNIAGFGVGIASFAGALFVFLMVATLVAGKHSDRPEELVPAASE
jgi:heme/copper-type cytochrome/quinol oxidase subunit 1